ncbi:DNA-directed RNA polymerase subunit alpha like [Melia azedarach]|uniref:DNA-directed RNA polymerase subunit alpha like n=1 Tax=Melia azedarach TaxID=155640 RepID=A0ACC1XWW9_MELAZ|nr:DNA-directed RNA polymerase subunit alpha like [Melia azedarach]
MDTHDIIGHPNTDTKPKINTNTNLDNDLSLDSSGFLSHNGYKFSNTTASDFHDHNPFQISDIEMISLQSATYTSLKDLLPPSPPAITSPTNNSSWYEIPIKNPLVKHAALAYLQPMSSPPEVGEKGLFGKLKETCYCQCECFGWINDVVFRSVRDVFWERREEGIDEGDEDEEKVD